jgi:DNA-directed RNA polymerase specialized sigma24 family protein
MADHDFPHDESFDALLDWLDPDRATAWERYEAIWDRLIKIFTWRNRQDVEDLAGEVVKRVIKKVPELVKTFENREPDARERYFYGVAYTLLLELPRQEARFSEFQEGSGLGGVTYPVDPEAIDVNELRLKCLDYCLEQLTQKDRQIILAYYQFDQATKGEARQRLAEELDFSKSALWTRVSRIRRILGRCVRAQLAKEGQTDWPIK